MEIAAVVIVLLLLVVVPAVLAVAYFKFGVCRKKPEGNYRIVIFCFILDFFFKNIIDFAQIDIFLTVSWRLF